MNWIYLTYVGVLLSVSLSIKGQSTIGERELQLSYHCDVMINAAESRHRVQAMEIFNREFLEVLQIVQAQSGKSIWLTDGFQEAEDRADSEFSSDQWLGSVYYNILSTQGKKKEEPYYLLFGMRRSGRFENIKMVDPLFFTQEGEAYFGKPVFRKSSPQNENKFYHRLLLNYSSDAKVTVNFNPGMNMIMADHLIERISRVPGQGKTMVPDGSYIGFEKKDGYWDYVDKIATEVMDAAPRPKPVLDERKGKKIFGN
ncbi:MAG: hypothetical protein LW630_05195 [Saprospiraceae bacterium]|nr:hypothetical protein [Saprospiraceae bacterium]